MMKKKPKIKISVGSFYYAFNEPTDESIDYDPAEYGEVVESPVIKTIGVEPNSESTVVRASGQDYTTKTSSPSEEIEVEVVAVDPSDLARMRGDVVRTTGLNSTGGEGKRPYFAAGYPIEKDNGEKTLVWHPKCQLVEKSDEVSTSEESFSEQNETLTIKAFSFNKNNDKRNYADSEMENYPEGLTNEKWFAKPIVTEADLTSALEETEDEEATGL